MPSPTGNIKPPQTHLTNRRSFGSSDSNFSSYDLDNVIETPVDKQDKKNKGILNNNNSQDTVTNYQQISSDNNSNNSNNNDNSKSWWRKFNPSLTLENKASVARDHLANERTFLAWLRTSLSFISIGIAITQLFRLSKLQGNDQRTTNEYDKGGKLLGIVFIILGIVFLSFGITRYFHSQYLMTKGHFPASRGSVVIGTILTVLVLATFFIIIIINDRK